MSRGGPESESGGCIAVGSFWEVGLRVFDAWCSIVAEVDDKQRRLSLVAGLEWADNAE